LEGETNGSHQPVDGESRQSSCCRLLHLLGEAPKKDSYSYSPAISPGKIITPKKANKKILESIEQ